MKFPKDSVEALRGLLREPGVKRKDELSEVLAWIDWRECPPAPVVEEEEVVQSAESFMRNLVAGEDVDGDEEEGA